MPAPSREPIRKHTLFLFAGDYARIGELYPDLGSAQAIRELVRQHIQMVEAASPTANIEVTTEVKNA